MPIIGLTDKQRPLGAALPLIARIYKGDERPESGNRPGADLDYFRVEFESQYLEYEAAFREIYGDKPAEFRNVFLTAPLVAQAVTTWNEEYTTGGLKYRCDGEQRVKHLQPDGSYSNTAAPCLGIGTGCKCKPTLRMSLFMAEFVEATKVLGTFLITSHSVHDILSLTGYLSDVERMNGGRLTGIPFIFGRRVKEISVPKPNTTNGQRIVTKKSLLYIYTEPRYTERLMQGLAGSADDLPTNALPGGIDPATGEITALAHPPATAHSPSLPEPAQQAPAADQWMKDDQVYDQLIAFIETLNLDPDGLLNALSVLDPNLTDPREFRGSRDDARAAILAWYCEYDAGAWHRMFQRNALYAPNTDRVIQVIERVNSLPF